MKTKVYIDGQSGTTGLQIYDRIGAREDLELMKIAEDKRHDLGERKKFLNEADIVFLCLPDQAAKESVSLIENENVKVIGELHKLRCALTCGVGHESDAGARKSRRLDRITHNLCDRLV